MAKSPKKLEPWQQQPGEPAQSWRHFCLYRDMHRRSLQGLAKMIGLKSARRLEGTSSKWGWQRRVQAWDQEMSRRVMDMQTDEIYKMRSRHTNLGIGMQTAVMKDLQALVHKVEEAHRKAQAEGKPHHDPVLTIAELVRLSEHGINIERLSRGEPSEITERKNAALDLSKLSATELKLLKKLKEKLEA